ncbi:hypothetical protein BDW71DRAFT_196349 [Aspergillus fruticulosus]
MAPTLNVTHIGTATALEINGARVVLEVTEDPALRLDQLPVIDAVLLSHEDHPDNLDDLGRQLLDGRRVFTTIDGGRKLAPPSCKIQNLLRHPPSTCLEMNVGFIVTGGIFGYGRDGLPNAIYFTGDTVFIEELPSIADWYHAWIAVMNLGNAKVPSTDDRNSPPMQITMGGKDGARLFRDLQADVLVLMHYEPWKYFTRFETELRQAFEAEDISDKICWLKGARRSLFSRFC